MIFTSFVTYIIILSYILNFIYFSTYFDTFNIFLIDIIKTSPSELFYAALHNQDHIILKIIMSLIITFIITALIMYLFNIIYNGSEASGGYSSSLSDSEYSEYILGVIYVILAVLVYKYNVFKLETDYLDYTLTLPENNIILKSTHGALHDLNRVYFTYKKIKNESFEKYAGGKTINQVMKIYFEDNYNNQDNISSLMEKEVKENGKSQAKHIFLIVTNSLSEYQLSNEFVKSGVSSSLIELAESKDGLKIPVFIQNGNETIKTMDTIFTGLYSTDFPLNETAVKLPCFDSAAGKIFKDLGYNTNFYYFGNGLWKNIGQYAASQGFENIYSKENMSYKIIRNWRRDEIEGLDLILNNLNENNNNPSFNLILTSSYMLEPIYESKENFDLSIYKLFEDMAGINYTKEQKDAGMDVYNAHKTEFTSKHIAEFIKKTYAAYPDSLFIITGDNFDKKHPNPDNKMSISTSVPLIIYGNGVSEYKFKYMAGSHKDIVPTIIDMTASAGYKYHSFGESLVTADNNSNINKERIAIGAQTIANGRFIYNGSQLDYFKMAEKFDNDTETAEKYSQKKKAGEALSWYIINNGYNVK